MPRSRQALCPLPGAWAPPLKSVGAALSASSSWGRADFIGVAGAKNRGAPVGQGCCPRFPGNAGLWPMFVGCSWVGGAGAARPLRAPRPHQWGPKSSPRGQAEREAAVQVPMGLPWWAWPLGQQGPERPGAHPFQARPRLAGWERSPGVVSPPGQPGALGSATRGWVPDVSCGGWGRDKGWARPTGHMGWEGGAGRAQDSGAPCVGASRGGRG